MCPDCIETKPAALTYTRCEMCGHWRKMTPEELAKVEKRRRG